MADSGTVRELVTLCIAVVVLFSLCGPSVQNSGTRTSALARNVRAAKPRAYRSVRTGEDPAESVSDYLHDGIEILPGNTGAKHVTIPLAGVMTHLEKLRWIGVALWTRRGGSGEQFARWR